MFATEPHGTPQNPFPPESTFRVAWWGNGHLARSERAGHPFPKGFGIVSFCLLAALAAHGSFPVPECEPGKLTPLPAEARTRLLQMTKRRIAEIQATPNRDIPVNAPRRYLSAASGDDAVDGLTPATAWKSTERLNREQLEPGTFVLFERGGVYRGGVTAKEGVTYTAWGSGPKPRILASPEDGADPARWEQTEVEGIWRYRIGERDVGVIVFDGGKAFARKILPVRGEDGSFTQWPGGRSFDHGYADIAEDLQFWHDYSAKTRFQPHAKGTGFLYLRSRENPGRRFSSIEFCVNRHGVAVGRRSDVTIDNLSIGYSGGHGVGAGTCRNLTVSNCEFAWIGGSIQTEGSPERQRPIRFGNAVEIYGGCDGFTVENCYIHDVYDAGVTPQADRNIAAGRPPIVQRRIRYADNVIERCTYSIEYFLSNLGDASSDPSGIEDFFIEGNILRDAAEGFGQHRPALEGGAHIKAWGGRCNNRAKGLVIRGNLFWGSRDMLVDLTATARNADGSDSMPMMDGNVFIGRAGQRLGSVNQGRPEGLVYDEEGVARLASRYPNNVFATETP